MHPLYLEDLEQACRDLGEVGALRGRRVLVTGVTGMIGACPRSPPNSTLSPTSLPIAGIRRTAVVF